jgi:glycosyltransferase involved in cell wall biosynthesis
MEISGAVPDETMRVLHILPSLKQTYGGPTRAVLDLSARAAEFGLQGEILGFGELDIADNPLPRHLIHALPIKTPKQYCYSPALRPWLRENLGRFDGVVLHGMWMYPNWAAAKECLKRKVPYACFPHGMLEPWAVYRQSRWKAIKKLSYWHLREQGIFSEAECVFFTTSRERTLAETTFHLGGMHLLLAPYGVDGTRKDVPRPERPELLQPPERKVALFLGRLHPKKNVELLIEAWTKSRPSGEWHLVIAGSGKDSYVRELQKSVARLGLEEQIHFVGFVTGADKSYLLQRASWFLLPSFQENFGVAVLEAITYGCPAVISDQVFIADDLHDRSEVLPVNTDAWVKFMRERMPDDSWRAELARLDRELLLPKMTIESVARSWASRLSQTFG